MATLLMFEGVRCECREDRSPATPVEHDFPDRFSATCPNGHEVELMVREAMPGEIERWAQDHILTPTPTA